MPYLNGKLITVRPVNRPYTSPLVKNPTYPVWIGGVLHEVSWEWIMWRS